MLTFGRSEMNPNCTYICIRIVKQYVQCTDVSVAIISQSCLNNLGLISTTLSDGWYLRFSIFISSDCDGCLDCLSPSLNSKSILILVIRQITAYTHVYMITHLFRSRTLRTFSTAPRSHHPSNLGKSLQSSFHRQDWSSTHP